MYYKFLVVNYVIHKFNVREFFLNNQFEYYFLMGISKHYVYLFFIYLFDRLNLIVSCENKVSSSGILIK